MLKKQRLPPVWLTKTRPAGYFSQTKHLPRSHLKHSLQPSMWGEGEVSDEQIISSGVYESQGLSLSSVLVCFVLRKVAFKYGTAFPVLPGWGMQSSVVCGPLPVAMAIESLPSREALSQCLCWEMATAAETSHPVGTRAAFECLTSDWNVLTLPDVIVDHRIVGFF